MLLKEAFLMLPRK